MTENEITERIIGAAIEVHQHPGPGLFESAADEGLCYELSRDGRRFERQVHLPMDYKGLHLDRADRMDLAVGKLVAVGGKAVDAINPVHQAPLLTYWKASGRSAGLLISCNVVVRKTGIRRLVNEYSGPPLSSPRKSPDLRASAVKEKVQ